MIHLLAIGTGLYFLREFLNVNRPPGPQGPQGPPGPQGPQCSQCLQGPRRKIITSVSDPKEQSVLEHAISSVKSKKIIAK